MGDRPFAFVRTPGPKGFPWHTGREQEELVLFRPHFREGGAATLPPDIEETFGLLEGSPMDIASVYDWFARDSMQAAEQTADCAGRS